MKLIALLLIFVLLSIPVFSQDVKTQAQLIEEGTNTAIAGGGITLLAILGLIIGDAVEEQALEGPEFDADMLDTGRAITTVSLITAAVGTAILAVGVIQVIMAENTKTALIKTDDYTLSLDDHSTLGLRISY